ncbi:MAG: hypothetical protein EP330_29375 [Deltaproteobacteria bacterium]|nr:MAG: hypothetical protein EP330_29375 [Deltaproteobacteria bacterium]
MSALWTLLRPKLLPYILLMPLAGYGWAHWDRALLAQNLDALPWVLVAWFFLHAGTMWLNAAVDKDEGEVLMGEAVPVPPFAVPAGYAALVAAVGLAFVAGVAPGCAAAGSAVLSVLYSHPRTLWKGHPLGGPFVNIVGYGLLSPYAGWSLAEVPVNPRTLVLWTLGAWGIAGAFFMAQAFQREEDAERGYRTLVVTHGPRACLWAGRIGIGGAFGGAMILCVLGWMPRVCLVALPFWWRADQLFAEWLRAEDGGTEAYARRLAKRLLSTALVLVVCALSQYVWQSAQNRPVAGLGTAAGHPSDRPLLPPRRMRQWEAAQHLERVRRAR